MYVTYNVALTSSIFTFNFKHFLSVDSIPNVLSPAERGHAASKCIRLYLWTHSSETTFDVIFFFMEFSFESCYFKDFKHIIKILRNDDKLWLFLFIYLWRNSFRKNKVYWLIKLLKLLWNGLKREDAGIFPNIISKTM